MSVVDASAYVDYLTSTQLSELIAPRLAGGIDVPAIFTSEVMSGLRGMVAGRRLQVHDADRAIDRVRQVERFEHPFSPFMARAWELRDNLSVYDAWYVALAEQLDTELLTTDRRLARASGPRCPVVLVA